MFGDIENNDITENDVHIIDALDDHIRLQVRYVIYHYLSLCEVSSQVSEIVEAIKA